jgi:hypothetical protein
MMWLHPLARRHQRESVRSETTASSWYCLCDMMGYTDMTRLTAMRQAGIPTTTIQ